MIIFALFGVCHLPDLIHGQSWVFPASQQCRRRNQTVGISSWGVHVCIYQHTVAKLRALR
jgi:hypothetical protein